MQSVWTKRPKNISDFKKNKKAQQKESVKEKVKSLTRNVKSAQCTQNKEIYNFKRKQKRQRQKTDEKKARADYLQNLSTKDAQQLHEQSWIKPKIKKFYKKLNQLKMAKCLECNERWYAPANYQPNLQNKDVCSRCKREITQISKLEQRDESHVTRFGKDNDMLPGCFSKCARNLTQIEELLVSPIITCMPV